MKLKIEPFDEGELEKWMEENIKFEDYDATESEKDALCRFFEKNEEVLERDAKKFLNKVFGKPIKWLVYTGFAGGALFATGVFMLLRGLGWL